MYENNWTWWYMPVILTLRRLSQEDLEFWGNAILGYTAIPLLKKQNEQTKKPQNLEIPSLVYSELL
jgi:hypothetical protein